MPKSSAEGVAVERLPEGDVPGSPPGKPLRVFLGAFGEPGHAFPMLAFGRALVARGHAVAFETWSRWREDIEAEGIRFVGAPQHPPAPAPEQPVRRREKVLLATEATRGAIRDWGADVVVHDILTLAPSLAGELEGRPVATLIPHIYPEGQPGAPPYALGARLPRTAVGRWGWRRLDPLVRDGLRQGRDKLNDTRRRLGLPPLERLLGGISAQLCIVGTFPQLEYPRRWPHGVHVVGPLMWEPAHGEIDLPAGDEPLVLVAPSTAQDPEHRLLSAALRGLGREPIRMVAALNRKPLPRPVPAPPNTALVDWVSYGRTMPHCSLVITHAGHGTLTRALACGCPVVAVPHSGDMGENAARADWAGVGRRLPWRFLTPRTLRLAVRSALEDRAMAAEAAALARWAQSHDGGAHAAALIEALAAGRWAGRSAGGGEA